MNPVFPNEFKKLRGEFNVLFAFFGESAILLNKIFKFALSGAAAGILIGSLTIFISTSNSNLTNYLVFSAGTSLFVGLEDYFQLYNYERPHQSLDYRTPADIHFAVDVPIL